MLVRLRAAPALLALALVFPGFLPAQALPLQRRAEAIVGARDDWSLLAWSVDRNRALFAINAEQIRTPASNNKVFTSIWALDLLGPDYRFATDLLATGPVEDGVLRGALVLRGSGDPSFGYPLYERDTLDPLRIMARQLRARGVQTVQGGVIADGTLFGDSLYGPDWPRDTGNGVSRYAPRVSGLSFQRNMLRVEAVSGPGGVQLQTTPRTDQIPISSNLNRGGGRFWATRSPDQDTIRVRGSASGRGNRVEIGVAQPALLAGEALTQALEEEGINVQGQTRVAPTPKDARLLHRHVSVALRELIPRLNQDSDNFFAEHLWKAAAAKALGRASYARGGPQSAIFFANRTKMPLGELWQADGSGLSSQNRASARALVSALAYANRRPWSEIFHGSLAVGGDPRGTLRRLFRGTRATGNLHAKTGYIRGVRTLSGYVRARNGELIAFSFLYNGRNTNGARAVQEQLGNLLADYAGSADAAPSAGDSASTRPRR